MKNTFTFILFLFAASIFAQEIGSAGTLLKNEASKTEMNSRIASNRFVTETKNRNNEKKQIFVNREVGRAQNLQWHNSLGYAELFLRIPENGFYTVSIDGQEISSSKGKFRFFDLSSGNHFLSIYENGYLIYKSIINIQNNYRLVLDFFYNEGLYLLDRYSIQNQNYGINEWDDIWNDYYLGTSIHLKSKVMKDTDFDDFINHIKSKSSFDDSKIQMINEQQKYSSFTTAQIKTLLSLLSFDKNKVILGKTLYQSCVDLHNFYRVYEVFTFNSYKKELMDFVSKQTK